MTFDEPVRDRLAAWRPVSPAPTSGTPETLGADLLAGARSRSARSELLAARLRAGNGHGTGEQDEAEHGQAEPHGAAQGDSAWSPAPRWAVSVRAAVAGALVLLSLAAGAAYTHLSRGPEVIVSTAAPQPTPVVGEVSGPGSAVEPASAPSPVVVHVVGAVREPGVVVLDAGDRTLDGVEAAGGATAEADLSSLNLARPVQDGEQVVVRRVGEEPSTGVEVGTGAAAGGVLDLNSADGPALEALPRIGPVLAGRILAWREEHGRFTSVEELTEIPGIGATLLAGLDGLVRV